ncbi:nSTAND1 domain-containing NTPase [Dictyobacter arantiisoli]|uniref:Novel STAND NTPase 2 domain-containing protein n=1 Tax=Dictyobacter arantiisoli TaxID=2014874 RepID=A0A5A5T590_9CHLR|nr:ATP-binding protein [Dictyobacter arantiisoli]GCF06472.1 hypothetical protein KDI_00360 [Dictyobacter arantiisoli]
MNPPGINPYYDYDAVRDPSMFFGRQQELKMLYNAIEKRQCVALVGSRHSGKSSLLKFLGWPEIQQRVGFELRDRIFILTDWREYLQKTREDFFRSVCEQIVAQSRAMVDLQIPTDQFSGEDKLKKLLEGIRDAGLRPVLLMDGFDKVTRNPHFDPDFFSFLRSLAGIYDLISYVTASIKPLYDVCHSDAVASSPFFNIFQTCIVSSLTLEETRQLIRVPSRQAGFEIIPTEVDWIISLAGRHPFYVQVSCRFLVNEKIHRPADVLDYELIKEQIYRELAPHFVNSWNDLNEDQQQSLRLELIQSNPERRKMPELSESSLFRQRVREFVQITGPELQLKELKDVLDNMKDNDFLENSRLAEMNYVTLLCEKNPTIRKGVHVRSFLKAGFERMQAGGIRVDSAPEWRLYNILWYHYFKHHLHNSQAAGRLGIGSMRQFYREQEHALQVLLKELLELEQNSLE